MTAGQPLRRLPGKVACALVTGALLLPLAPAASAAANTVHPAAATASTASFLQRWPVLRQGPNSDWPRATVRSLQYLLRARGSSISVDGVFGPQTRTAVVAFQRSHHVRADGIVGSPTWTALIITVRLGSRGDAVRAVQDQINFRNLRDGHTLNVDGVFGPSTRRAVIAFQRGLALEIRSFPVDGVVGPQTWPPLVNEALSG